MLPLAHIVRELLMKGHQGWTQACCWMPCWHTCNTTLLHPYLITLPLTYHVVYRAIPDKHLQVCIHCYCPLALTAHSWQLLPGLQLGRPGLAFASKGTQHKLGNGFWQDNIAALETQTVKWQPTTSLLL